MKSTLKFLTAFTLLILLSVSVFSAPSAVDVVESAYETVVAEDAEIMDEGTETTPIVISSAKEFNTYANLIKTNNAVYGSKYYKLSGNIDFDGVTMVPFGTENSPFTGTFDGDGYAITNLSIPDVLYSGVIGYMTKGTVKDLFVEYKDMASPGSFSSIKYFGGILGYAVVESGKSITVSGCATAGDLKVNTSVAVYYGGITGYIKSDDGDATFSNCVSQVSYDVESKKSGYLGGFVGYAKGGSSHGFIFRNCVSYGDVRLVSSFLEATVGAFVGYANKDSEGWSGWASEEEYAELLATVYQFEKCVCLGNVYGKASSDVCVGGFVGCIDGEGDINMSSCYRPSSQVVEAADAKVIKKENAATQTTIENLNDESFYSSSLGFDFTYQWYMSGSSMQLRTVTKSYGAATVHENASIRLSSYRKGLRFTAEIETFKRDYCYEYGFIVASADLLGDEELTFDFYPCSSGIAYNGDDVDIFLDKDDETLTYTAVVYNIDESLYSKDIVARAYVSYECDGEIITLYGNAVRANVSSTAAATKNSPIYDILDADQKTLLESMIVKQ